jgi:cytochrome c556
MKRQAVWIVIVAALTVPTPVLADGAMSIIARKSCMKASASALSALNPMHKGDKPFDAALVANTMSRVELVCGDWKQFWPEDSQSVPGFETRAARTIWSDPASFQRASDVYLAAIKALATSADDPSFKANFSTLGQTCTSCHQTFRGPD